MRYAHIIPQSASIPGGLPSSQPPRKFRPIKHVNTLALNLRHTLLANRAPFIVLILLSLPFLTAIISLLSRPQLHPTRPPVSRPVSTLQHAAPPHVNNPTPHYSSSSIKAYIKLLRARRSRNSLSAEPQLTVIAACASRQQSLAMSFPSWVSHKQVSHVVLVEWSSSDFQSHQIPHFNQMLHTGRLSVILADGGPWALSRAYNLASRFVMGRYILKVDCDTHLRDDFFTKHPFPEKNAFYTLTWGAARDANEDKLRGVFLAHTENFRKVGGYDERITHYGFEDGNLYHRFSSDLGLEFKALNLESIRHNVAAQLALQPQADQYIISRQMSVRVNEELVKTLPNWGEVYKAQSSKYALEYDAMYNMVRANVTQAAPDAYAAKSEDERDELLVEVVQKGLHDDFKLPWDLLPALGLEDLTFLTRYLDRESEPRVLVALLEGEDTLANMFNLVSALQLAMTHGRPVIALWKAPGGGSVTDVGGPLLRELIDVEGTNEQLGNIAKSEGMRKWMSGTGRPEDVRLIAGDQWRCVEGLSICADKYDPAYKSFNELETKVSYVYDEVEEAPLGTTRHTLVRLRDQTKIGNLETRGLAWKAIVQSGGVRDAQQEFVSGASVVAVAEKVNGVAGLAEKIRREHGSWVESGEKEIVPVVGRGSGRLREELFGKRESGELFCSKEDCTIRKMVMEVANVMSGCEAQELEPKREVGSDRKVWMEREDISYMMMHDLWTLQRQQRRR